MDRLFVVNKPPFISSAKYANQIKRKYNFKNIGFSGTLDPFATGALIVATGKFTKLFQYLKKTPKVYQATMWLGVESKSIDLENIISINKTKELKIEDIKKTLNTLLGKIEYLPPIYSAKKINGKRAYELAREDKEVELKKIKSTIYDIKLINYNHPFLTFEASVSEGAYIRSIALLIAKKLKTKATLSALKRVKEGEFRFENEKFLNPYEHLKIKKNIYLGDFKTLELGKKLSIKDFKIQKDGIYLVESKNYNAIIEIDKEKVKYKINNLPKEWR